MLFDEVNAGNLFYTIVRELAIKNFSGFPDLRRILFMQVYAIPLPLHRPFHAAMNLRRALRVSHDSRRVIFAALR